jgi:hypothetical protein
VFNRLLELPVHHFNLRILEEITPGTYDTRAQQLRDQEAELKLQIERADRGRHEIIDLAIRAFELSQNLRAKWFTAD